jgi:uncharacterized protein (DUF934 family)
MALYKVIDGQKIAYTKEEEAAFKKKWATPLVVEYTPDNQKYKLQRTLEYPAVIDQLDYMFHHGFDAWKAMIQAIKTKYPKPE